LLEDFHSTHWKVALELLLRTVKLISERRTASDIIFERANIFILEKRWYREKLPSSFYDEGSFLFVEKICNLQVLKKFSRGG